MPNTKKIKRTNPFVPINKEYALIYGELIIRFGQLERIVLNLIKRCDQKITKKTLSDIYSEYGPDTLGQLVKYLGLKKVNGRTFKVPKGYTKKIHKRLENLCVYRNQVVHSYYSIPGEGKNVHIRYIENGKGKKPKGHEKKVSLEHFLMKAKKKVSEVYELNKTLDGLAK